MICAHTVRKLKPGTFDQFAEAFRPPDAENAPAGWVSFTMLRGQDDPDQVVTFGIFEGTAEDLEAGQADADSGYADRIKAIEPLVEAVVSSDIYDVAVQVQREG